MASDASTHNPRRFGCLPAKMPIGARPFLWRRGEEAELLVRASLHREGGAADVVTEGSTSGDGHRVPVPRVAAVIFDTDGVITRTASVHAAAWKAMFDDFLRRWAEKTGEPFVPFEDEDYVRDVDGRARYDGVAGFLATRGIPLPRGEPTTHPIVDTVCGLGNRKNDAFVAEVREHGVEPFESTLVLARALRAPRHPHGCRLGERELRRGARRGRR